jgi:hypothetical protein
VREPGAVALDGIADPQVTKRPNTVWGEHKPRSNLGELLRLLEALHLDPKAVECERRGQATNPSADHCDP